MSKSVAELVRSQVLESEDEFWRVEDFSEGAHAVATALKRLADEGELERMRRGLYWRGRQTRFGMTSPGSVQLLEAVLGSDIAVGATGWSATNLLGLSTQVAPQPMFAVTARVPSGVPGLRLVDRSARKGRNRAQLDSTEVTFLEALEGWDSFVEVEATQALERFSSILCDESVRVDRVVKAADTESATVRERLRLVLEHADLHEASDRVQSARSLFAKDRAYSVLAGV